jgi:hypothetical protein
LYSLYGDYVAMMDQHILPEDVDYVAMTDQHILPEDDALVLKHVGAINTEQHNKLSIRCAFVCLFVIYRGYQKMYTHFIFLLFKDELNYGSSM